MTAVIAPWDSIGFQILFWWIIFIIVALWLGGRLKKTRDARRHEEEVRRWRAQQERRWEEKTRNGRAA